MQIMVYLGSIRHTEHPEGNFVDLISRPNNNNLVSKDFRHVTCCKVYGGNVQGVTVFLGGSSGVNLESWLTIFIWIYVERPKSHVSPLSPRYNWCMRNNISIIIRHPVQWADPTKNSQAFKLGEGKTIKMCIICFFFTPS